jgi:cysteinyl-tRNA synthetase
VDILGGGQDLVFPHHENEIAQSEAYTSQRPMARFWVHNGLMRLGDDRMSKSLGNLVTVGEALEQYSSDALRLFFLTGHYRGPLTYTGEGVAAQERAAARLRYAATPPEGSSAGEPLDPEPFRRRFVAAMDDDLNTPRAIATLFDLARDINRAREDGGDVVAASGELRELAGVLGLTLQERPAQGDAEVGPLIEMLIEARARLREARLYDGADALRDRLAEHGYVLEDTPGGTEWKRHER